MHIYQAVSYQQLVIQLAHNCKVSTHAVFVPEYIVGANLITQNYLTEQLASYNSITANVKFQTWTAFIQQVFRILKPQNFEAEYVADLTSTQYLVDILADCNFYSKHPSIYAYYEGDANKRYGLAQKLQQLFANYGKYNPALLCDWNKGIVDNPTIDESFQYDLWKAYRVKLHTHNQYDSFEIIETIRREIAIQSPQLAYLAAKIPSFHLVRMENLTQFQIELIELLAPYVEVYCYTCTLESTSSSLLAKLWSAYAPSPFQTKQRIDLNPVTTPTPTTLLGALQQALYSDIKTRLPLDNSIQIHGHFTPFREVEGLLNTLIDTYASTAFNARDILVYCNDLKEYIPAIHHFFNHPDYAIPYRIIGEYNYDNDNAIQAFDALLHYNIEVMNPEEMMALLQYSTIQQRFGLDHIEVIRSWIGQANIRFQYEGDEQLDLHYMSWKVGLDRLLLGSCIGIETAYKDDIYLLDVAEGNEMNQLIHFRYFVEQLYNLKTQTREAKTIEGWIEYTLGFISVFFDLEKTAELDYLISQLSNFDTKSPMLYSYKTWAIMLSDLIEQPVTKVVEGVGGVSFVELKNAQVIPSSFVAILGLNHSTYPAKTAVLAFDLLKNNTEYKAKSTKERDKFTFLQSILQAKEQLYISYLNKDVQSNNAIPPSILVEQLLDEINTVCLSKLHCIEHPLHSFSTRYNQHTTLKSYTLNEAVTTNFKTHFKMVDPPIDLEEKTVTVEQLVSFFMDSFRYFYNHNLGIYYKDDKNELPSFENLEIQPLDRWIIRDYMIKNKVNWSQSTVDEQAAILQSLQAQGILPLANLGPLAFEQTYQDYAPVLDAYATFIDGQQIQRTTARYSVKIDHTLYHVESTKDIVKDQYVHPIISSQQIKNLVEWLLNSYILLTNNCVHQTAVYYPKRKQKECLLQTLTLNQDTVQELLSTDILKEMLTAFHIGQTRLMASYIPKALLPYETAEQIMEALDKEEYKSEYLTKEYYKSYFSKDQQVANELLANYQLIYNLITKL